MKTLSIDLAYSYTIYLDKGLLETHLLKDYCLKLNKRPVIVTDSHLIHSIGKQLQDTLQTQGISVELIAFPAGEAHKTRETKQQLEDELLQKCYGRDTVLIALGGGVVTDLVGFLGATYCRGIPVIYIPTTLLAMVDASIGGKTGVNTPHGKNLIGTFTQPHVVLMDTQTLCTLPEKEWCNGLVEIIKHSLIADDNLFSTLQTNSSTIKNHMTDIIYTSCCIKKHIVEQDEREQGMRQFLNFGHTIGHAIEIIENYHLGHGEAVAIGILVESYLSAQAGHLPFEDFLIIKNLLQTYHLPLKTSAFQKKTAFREALVRDKKSLQSIPQFVLLERIGKPYQHQGKYTTTVKEDLLDQILEWAADTFRYRTY